MTDSQRTKQLAKTLTRLHPGLKYTDSLRARKTMSLPVAIGEPHPVLLDAAQNILVTGYPDRLTWAQAQSIADDILTVTPTARLVTLDATAPDALPEATAAAPLIALADVTGRQGDDTFWGQLRTLAEAPHTALIVRTCTVVLDDFVAERLSWRVDLRYNALTVTRSGSSASEGQDAQAIPEDFVTDLPFALPDTSERTDPVTLDLNGTNTLISGAPGMGVSFTCLAIAHLAAARGWKVTRLSDRADYAAPGGLPERQDNLVDYVDFWEGGRLSEQDAAAAMERTLLSLPLTSAGAPRLIIVDDIMVMNNPPYGLSMSEAAQGHLAALMDAPTTAVLIRAVEPMTVPALAWERLTQVVRMTSIGGGVIDDGDVAQSMERVGRPRVEADQLPGTGFRVPADFTDWL